MADEAARTEEEPDVEAHGTSGNDVVEGASGGLHEDDSDDVEAHVFAQGFSGGFQGGTQPDIKDGASGG